MYALGIHGAGRAVPGAAEHAGWRSPKTIRSSSIAPCGRYEGQAKPKYVGGRMAARIKAGIVKLSLWATSHPTLGMPKRKHRLAATPDVSAEKALA
uniref:hypothetical protein n=1 Tax=Microbispora cellulosiformans TaxID=2614688 RepID=UPI001CD9C50D|nr:hypothetical protein [Microbispora cellulosiformans]